MPKSHVDFLIKLKVERGFEPRVCYDIGSCVLHWSKVARRIWPNTKCVLFDAFEPLEFLYAGYDYHIGALGAEDDTDVQYYYSNEHPGGNSYYKENDDRVFPPNVFKTMKTCKLDTVVAQKGFPAPDLIKIDAQGSELDIIKGARDALQHARVLIVEMQHKDYNRGAPKVHETKPYIESLGWICIGDKFSNNGPDADYCFIRMGE